MKLKDWLKTGGPDGGRVTATAFAARIGVVHSTVLRYVGGKIFPSGSVIEAIERETEGKVTAADLLEAFKHQRRLNSDEMHRVDVPPSCETEAS